MAKDLMVSWLRDVHGLEGAKVEAIRHMLKDFEGHTDIQDRLEEYSKRSEQQAAEIEAILQQLDEKASTGKSLIGKLTAMIPGIGSDLYRDRVVKDMLVLHAAAHFSHACYVSLAEGAKHYGSNELMGRAQEIAHQEEEMGRWFLEQIPPLTDKVLMEQNK